MSDIVERLRDRKEPNIEFDMHYPQIVDSDTPDAECLEAAAEIDRLRAEVERLRAALEFYAEKENYSEQLVAASCGCCCDYEDAKVFVDEGAIARAALAEEKQR